MGGKAGNDIDSVIYLMVSVVPLLSFNVVTLVCYFVRSSIVLSGSYFVRVPASRATARCAAGRDGWRLQLASDGALFLFARLAATWT